MHNGVTLPHNQPHFRPPALDRLLAIRTEAANWPGGLWYSLSLSREALERIWPSILLVLLPAGLRPPRPDAAGLRSTRRVLSAAGEAPAGITDGENCLW